MDVNFWIYGCKSARVSVYAFSVLRQKVSVSSVTPLDRWKKVSVSACGKKCPSRVRCPRVSIFCPCPLDHGDGVDVDVNLFATVN